MWSAQVASAATSTLANAVKTKVTNIAFPNERVRKGEMPAKVCAGTEVKYDKCMGEKAVCESCSETINCQLGPWTDWSACLCDGLMERSRRVLQSNNECGTPCDDHLVETNRCDWPDIQCLDKPVNCTWVSLDPQTSEKRYQNGTDPHLGWSAWTTCAVDPQSGLEPTQKFRYRVVSYSQHGGAGCDGAVNQTEPCPVNKNRAEDQDCGWSEWSEWGACTCPCGGGQKTRYRHVADAPRGRGKLCEPNSKAEIVACNTQSCSDPCTPDDALWGEWGDWGHCSKSCGTGKHWRNRTLTKPATCGGKVPPGSSVDIQDCKEQETCGSIDCEFNHWSDWSDCSCTCEGIAHRFRTIKTFGEKGGDHCEGPLKQVRECNQYTTQPDCQGGPRLDCHQEWTQWSECTKPCDGGQRFRNNTIKSLPSNGGLPCEDLLAEVQPCNEGTCADEPVPVPCAMSEWTDWSDCDKCGGQKRRNRHIIQMPRNKGAPCEDQKGNPWPAEETAACERACGELQCCVWGPWTPEGVCMTPNAKNCGPGFQKLVRQLGWGSCTGTVTTTTTTGSTTTVTTCIVVPAQTEMLFDAESVHVSRTQNVILSFALGSLITTIVSALVLRVSRGRHTGSAVILDAVE